MLLVSRVKKTYPNGAGIILADFAVTPGNVLSLVGPNGSGKTTLIKTICGIYRIDNGFIKLKESFIAHCHNEIGYLPETPYFIMEYTVNQFIKYIAGLKKCISTHEINELVDLLGVRNLSDCKLFQLSQGQKKRVALICSLINYPYLLLLDEPTNGLDPEAIIVLKNIIKKRRQDNKITIISSHILDFIKTITDIVIFIKEGVTYYAEFSLENIENEYTKLYLST
jgi:ABC-type multidrug transport system ATPase subunit